VGNLFVDIDKTCVWIEGVEDTSLFRPIHTSVHSKGYAPQDGQFRTYPVEQLCPFSRIHQVVLSTFQHKGADLGGQIGCPCLKFPCARFGEQQEYRISPCDVHCLFHVVNDVKGNIGNVLYGQQGTDNAGYLAQSLVNLILQIVHDQELARYSHLSALDERKITIHIVELAVHHTCMDTRRGCHGGVYVNLSSCIKNSKGQDRYCNKSFHVKSGLKYSLCVSTGALFSFTLCTKSPNARPLFSMSHTNAVRAAG